MKRFAGDIALAALAGLALSGCATRSAPVADVATVRSTAPVNYESTVHNYFDLTMPAAAAPRRLAFSAPESSRCALYGPGGRHAGWVVPVIYHTAPQPAPPMSVSPDPVSVSPAAKRAVDKKTKTPTKASATAAVPVLKVSTSGTASSTPAGMSLNDVSVTGTRYFFWFSGETLGAVTRQADLCP